MTTEFRTTTKPVTLDSWYLHTDGTYGFYAGAARVGGPTMTHFAATAAECVKRDENGAVYEVGWPARGETTKYIEISETAVPADVRFDVPRRLQGQTVEVAYGGFDRAEHDHGDPYKRVRDRSDGSVTYYRRAD